MEVIVPVVTAAISAVAAVVSVWYGRRSALADRMATAEDIAARFREPLLQAVFNLETRIYNIVELGFLDRFLGGGTEDEREYAVLNTLYVFAQYFCWIEIVRRESQFVDPRSVERNRVVAHTLEEVRDSFSDSRHLGSHPYRLFRGEQRALGEVMLVAVDRPHPGTPAWSCMGYAPFVKALDDPDIARWFRRLRCDIEAAVGAPAAHHGRLLVVQQRLIDVIDALDPDAERIPSGFRTRLEGFRGS